VAACPIRGYRNRLRSNLIARSPGQGDESRDQKNNNEHPILAFETKKAECLNKKFHRSRPFNVQDTAFGHRNI
jgi:hypothetical protein